MRPHQSLKTLNKFSSSKLGAESEMRSSVTKSDGPHLSMSSHAPNIDKPTNDVSSVHSSFIDTELEIDDLQSLSSVDTIDQISIVQDGSSSTFLKMFNQEQMIQTDSMPFDVNDLINRSMSDECSSIPKSSSFGNLNLHETKLVSEMHQSLEPTSSSSSSSHQGRILVVDDQASNIEVLDGLFMVLNLPDRRRRVEYTFSGSQCLKVIRNQLDNKH